MESKRKILFVINPISGTGKKKIIEKLLEEYLDKSAIEFEIKYTEFAGHAIEISKKVVDQNNYECVIAVGGDGSVNEVANGLIGSICYLKNPKERKECAPTYSRCSFSQIFVKLKWRLI